MVLTTMCTKLRRYRLENGLTLVEMGGKVGVAGVSIHRYETGERLPRSSVMERICRATDGYLTPADFYPAIPAGSDLAA